jgi:hypothetical protein
MDSFRRSLGAVAVVASAGAIAIACGGSDGGDPVDPAPDAGEAGQLDGTLPDVAPPDAGDSGDAGDADASGGTSLDGGACDGGALAVATVTPKFGMTTDKTTLTETGAGFLATPKMYLRSGAALTPLTSVAFVSSTSVSGVAPSGLAVGTYDVLVVNPGDCAGVLAGSFKVVADPVPVVLTVTPATGTTQTDVPVTITGCNFPANATTFTVGATGVEVQHLNDPPAAGANDPLCNNTPLYTMTGTIQTKTKTLAAGAYVVRVKNPTNATYGDYSSFVVSNPTGNLTGGWKAGPSLVTGRRSLSLVAGRVDDARRFLYAVGGENAGGVPLKTVEVAPVDRFGQLGAWFVGKNQLVAARSGHDVVRQGKYLYALGGTSSTGGTGGAAPAGTPLASIERAVILDPSGAPKITDPVVTAGGGTLAKGTFYYKVAAVLDATDPATEGETLASDEIVATLDAAGKVELTWTAPAVGTATHYRVYRTTAADGTSGAEVLLKDNIASTTYTDTGADVPGTEKPMPLGSTGRWLTSATSLLHARVGAASVIAPDPTAARHLYVLGGYGQCVAVTGVMDCYEHATISDDGATLGPAFVAGALPLTRGRMRHGAATMSVENGGPDFATNAGAGTAFVILGGGRGVNTSANTVEYALVGAAGALGAFGNPTSGFANERDGMKLLVASGYGYALQGGNAPNYALTSDQSAPAVVTATTVSFANWANAGANLATKLGRHGAAAESAFFYVAGGTTNDNDALATVYQVLH